MSGQFWKYEKLMAFADFENITSIRWHNTKKPGSQNNINNTLSLARFYEYFYSL